MGRSVYIASFGEGGGKSTVALGLAELLSRQVGRIGAFRPLVTVPGQDPILDLLRRRYAISLPADDLHGATYAEATALLATGRREELISQIVERYRAVERQVPAMVVIGSDLEDNDDPRQLGFNARLATELNSVAVAVVDGQTDDPASAMSAAYHSLTDLGATVLAVIANRAPVDVVPPALPVPAYVIPEVPTVSAPTVGEVATALGATVLTGDARAPGPRRARPGRRRRTRAGVPRPPDRRLPGDHPRRPGRPAGRGVQRARQRAGRGGRSDAHPRRATRRAGDAADRPARQRARGALGRVRQLPHGGGGVPDRGPAQRDQPTQGGGRARRVRVPCRHRGAGRTAAGGPLVAGHPADVRVRPDRPGPLGPPPAGAPRGHRGADPARRRDPAPPRRRRPHPAGRHGRHRPPGTRARRRHLRCHRRRPGHQPVAGRVRHHVRRPALAQGRHPRPGVRRGAPTPTTSAR